jgi:hypothetical protein
VVALKEVILEDKSIYMVFDYAEHDFLVSIIHSMYNFGYLNQSFLSNLFTTIPKRCARKYHFPYSNHLHFSFSTAYSISTPPISSIATSSLQMCSSRPLAMSKLATSASPVSYGSHSKNFSQVTKLSSPFGTARRSYCWVLLTTAVPLTSGRSVVCSPS